MANKFEEQTFKAQLGQQATVQRTSEKGRANENSKLFELGRDLHPLPNTETEHVGSAAMHVYYHKRLKQFFVVSQVAPMKDCQEQLAMAAVKDFIGSIIEHYGHRRPKLRSGF